MTSPALITGYVLLGAAALVAVRMQKSVFISESASTREWVKQDSTNLSDDATRYRVGDLHHNTSVSKFNSLTHRGDLHGGGERWLGK